MSYTESRYNSLAFDAGEAPVKLRGSEWADKIEDLGRKAVSGIHQASQDQEGIGDDILRAGGKVLQGVGTVAELPGVKQGLQVLDAPFHYGSKLAGGLAESMGIDPRLGEWAVRAGEVATGVGALKKAPKVAGKLATEASEFAIRNAPPGSVMRMVADTGGGVVPPPKAYQGRTQKWNKWVEKFGGEKGAKQASDIQNEALQFWEAQKKVTGKGNLKDFGTLREINGKQYYIKNKANSLKEPNFNFDSLENTTAGKILREQSAKVDEKMVKKAVARINKNRKKMGTDKIEGLITDEQVAQYIAAQKKNKADLKKLIRNLNYDEGKRTWSLGHIEAVKSHTDKGKAGADMITNLELEPFRDMFDEATGKWIRGNASRSNIDELEDILLQAINKAETLDEDIIKFLDSDIGNFWPRKIGVKDRKTWLKESGKMEEYIEALKSKGVDEVLNKSDFGKKSLEEPAPIPKMKIR